MSDEATVKKIVEAADEIAATIGNAWLELSPRMKAQFDLDGASLAVAFVRAAISLTCITAAGIALGPGRPEAEYQDLAESMANEIHPIIDNRLRRQ
jgi:hypothetical protein